jgi:TldD protein
MADLAATEKLFFERTGLDRGRVAGIVKDAVGGAEDGELFLEYRQSESLTFDDGRLRTASRRLPELGLRAVVGELTGLPMPRS